MFEKHGTRGTWYAHASVGCLHVRPVLNLRQEKDVKAMRAIAEEAFAMVRDYKGSHSGEHGDGIVRSEFHEFMFGKRLVKAFEEVKDKFDPKGLLNPGKIVRAPKFDDRSKFRYGPDYRAQEMKAALDWSAYPGAGGGFQGAVEMCNNNGACRKAAGGVMCPSYRVTRDERDVTRGRANSLRLAITGQLGPDALTSDEMAETMKLCVSCKGCRRECPTGVDMARMKIEVQAARAAKHGLSLRDRLIGWMPRYAPYAAMMPWAVQRARQVSEAREALRAARRLQHAAHPAAVAQGCVRRFSTSAACGGRERAARASVEKSCCSPTPSTAISSARTSTPPSRCCRRPATRCISPSPRTIRSARSAAAARSSSVGKVDRGAARGRARDRGGRALRRARRRRWSGWSRAASWASATKSRR